MTKSNTVFKRVRPLMGTFVEITLFNEGEYSALVTQVFDEADLRAKIFSPSGPDSDHEEMAQVMKRATQVAELSGGAFSADGDLNGIAKGYIVDRMVEKILSEQPAFAGLVNAGGDLRFFNCDERNVDLRLGSVDLPVFRTLSLGKNALATSSPSRSVDDLRSTTRYKKALRPGLNSNCTVSVVADECWVADALTKVGLFADRDTAKSCAKFFRAQIMVFDGQGELIDILGNHEAE